MQVTLLGTGNPLPDPNRAGAATLVRAGALTVLFDAGRGVLMLGCLVLMPPSIGRQSAAGQRGS